METQILKRSFFCSYEEVIIYMKGLSISFLVELNPQFSYCTTRELPHKVLRRKIINTLIWFKMPVRLHLLALSSNPHCSAHHRPDLSPDNSVFQSDTPWSLLLLFSQQWFCCHLHLGWWGGPSLGHLNQNWLCWWQQHEDFRQRSRWYGSSLPLWKKRQNFAAGKLFCSSNTTLLFSYK